MVEGLFPSDPVLWMEILKGLTARRGDFLWQFAHNEWIGFLVLSLVRIAGVGVGCLPLFWVIEPQKPSSSIWRGSLITGWWDNLACMLPYNPEIPEPPSSSCLETPALKGLSFLLPLVVVYLLAEGKESEGPERVSLGVVPRRVWKEVPV